MVIKGIKKGDKDLRHFKFDDGDYVVKDGVYYYKVTYDKNPLEGEYGEEEDGYVECSKVIPLGGRKPKPIPGIIDAPKPQVVQQEVQQPKEVQQPVVKEPEPKKRGRKSKDETITVTVPQQPDENKCSITTYEYYVTEMEVNDISGLQSALNEKGKSGWEMCGFETNKNLFGKLSAVVVFKRKRG